MSYRSKLLVSVCVQMAGNYLIPKKQTPKKIPSLTPTYSHVANGCVPLRKKTLFVKDIVALCHASFYRELSFSSWILGSCNLTACFSQRASPLVEKCFCGGRRTFCARGGSRIWRTDYYFFPCIMIDWFRTILTSFFLKMVQWVSTKKSSFQSERKRDSKARLTYRCELDICWRESLPFAKRARDECKCRQNCGRLVLKFADLRLQPLFCLNQGAGPAHWHLPSR